MNDQTCTDSPQLVSPAKRRAYQSPRLSLLGDVCSLTEAGSVQGSELGMIFGMFSCGWNENVNMNYNMC